MDQKVKGGSVDGYKFLFDKNLRKVTKKTSRILLCLLKIRKANTSPILQNTQKRNITKQEER
jgi:hypothetical protein